MLAKLAGWVYAGDIVAKWAKSFDFAFYTSVVLLVIAAVVAFLLKAPHHHEEPEADPDA